MRTFIVSTSVLLLFAATASAVSFTEIRIGDIDGFGLGTGAGLVNANGSPVNVDGVGPLGNGDFLPDWSGNGTTATGSGDDFDYRSPAEVSDALLTGAGFTNVGTTGSNYTDIAVSTSYDSASSSGSVYVPGGQGAGGPFPSPPSGTLSNQPGFVFDFTVDQADLAAGTPMFFNMVYGDYDISPATVRLTTVGGSTITRSITVQPPAADGLIQAAFLNLAFTDVFAPQGSDWVGRLRVDFLAPREPYTAFDFVELSTRQIQVDPVIPEPMTVLGAMGAITAVGGYLRRRRLAG
jgi:hypothetical protein